MKLTIRRLALSRKRFMKRLHPLNVLLVVVTALAFSLSAYWQVSGLTHSKSTSSVAKVKLSVSKSEPKQAPPAPAPVVSPTPVAATPTSKPVTPITLPKKTVASVVPGVAVGKTSQPVVTPSPSSSVSGLTPTSSGGGTSPSSSSGSGSDPGAGSGTGSTPTPPPTTTTSYTSTNWSGYLEASGDYTSVSGSWVVPSVTNNTRSTSVDSAWVGIGGVTSSDLIQIGTTDTVTTRGQVSSSAFYEMLPDVSITIPGMTISAGDSISASVAESSNDVWTISILDNTSGSTFTKVVDYTSTHSSAEWVEEDPSFSNGHLIPFANFDSINFFNAGAISSGTAVNLNSGYAQPITMVNSFGQPIATPSAIGSNATSFSVVYD